MSSQTVHDQLPARSSDAAIRATIDRSAIWWILSGCGATLARRSMVVAPELASGQITRR
jgi:hypothetical protein